VRPEFTFWEVEQALAGVFGIPESRWPTLRERIRHFHRLDLLGSVSPGRGKAASYSAGDLLILGLAFELAELGVPAQRATLLIKEWDYHLAQSILSALSDDEPGPILFLDPDGLGALRGDETVAGTARSFAPVPFAKLGEAARDLLRSSTHYSIINLGELVVRFETMLADWIDPVALREELRSWAAARVDGGARDGY